MFDLHGIDHVALAVRDPRRTLQWYIDVLGFEHRHAGMWNDEPLFIGKGATSIALFAAGENARPASSRGDHIGMLHLAFGTSAVGFEAAQRELQKRGIDSKFSDHEISRSIYFYDPDGNLLEITTYELT